MTAMRINPGCVCGNHPRECECTKLKLSPKAFGLARNNLALTVRWAHGDEQKEAANLLSIAEGISALYDR